MSVGETSVVEKSLEAEEAIDSYIIVKFGSSDDKIKKGAAATDKVIGVAQAKASAAGVRINVMLSGVTLVRAGGTVARGDLLTTDTAGKAIATTTAKNRLVGMAVGSGVKDDVIPMVLSQTAI